MNNFNIELDKKLETGFVIPENYFENLCDKLIDNLPAKEVKVIPIKSRKNLWIYTAAAALILPISLVLINNFLIKSSTNDTIALENYISNNTSINENDIAELLSEKDIQKIKIDFKLEDNTLENELSNNQNIEEYLIN